jgi:CBS domain containing-hemolysin-like protein
MYWISIIAAPFIWLLTFTSDIIIKLYRIKPTAESKITEEEIKALEPVCILYVGRSHYMQLLFNS